MNEQTYRSRPETADRLPPGASADATHRPPAAISRGPVLPRFDSAQLRQHLPGVQQIRIEVNGVLAGAPEAIPDATAEFAIGWAFLHRFFSTANQLGKLSASERHVSLMVDSGIDLDRLKYEAIGWIPRNDIEDERPQDHSARAPRAVSVMSELDAIATCHQAFDRFDSDGAKAGYIHSALATADEVVCVARDLCGAAAACKVLGWVMSTRFDCAGSMLVVRGVLDRPIVEAAARAGIPIVATDAVPTENAVASAANSCVTIVGLARSHRRGLFADGGHLTEDGVIHLDQVGTGFEIADV